MGITSRHSTSVSFRLELVFRVSVRVQGLWNVTVMIHLRVKDPIPFRIALYSWKYIHILCILSTFWQPLPHVLQVHIG